MNDEAPAPSPPQAPDLVGSRPRSVDDRSVAQTLRASPGVGGAAIPTGTLLEGTYRVLELIGQGAMGAVYLVEHVALGKRFAAKIVAGSARMDAAAVQRLRNEARMASAIDHEHIVDVSHLGTTEDGHVFVVMELLRGEDLRSRSLRQRQRAARGEGTPWLPDAEVRVIAAAILSALEAAHRAGVVHRDLKPENIFLHERGGKVVPKIVDFGIGKLRSPDAEDLRLTATGQIVGTPLYMAPEQTRSTSLVDHRADLYAMGVMLFELLTGRLPFEANHLYEIVVKHATEAPPDPRSFRRDLPDAVSALVLRCLAKDPADRYASAAELLDAWEQAWAERGPVSLWVARSSDRASEPIAPSRRSGASSMAETLPAEPAVSGPAPAPLRASEAVRPSGTMSETRAPTSPRDAQAVRHLRSPAMLAGGAMTAFLLLVGGWVWWSSQPPAPLGEPGPTVSPPAEASPDRSDHAHPDPPSAAPLGPRPAEEPEVSATSATTGTPPARPRRRIESEPPGAEVLRDGAPIGTTPLELELEAGEVMRLELRRRGYRAVVETVSDTSPEVVRTRLPRREAQSFPELAPR